jgi:hypothetical protein
VISRNFLLFFLIGLAGGTLGMAQTTSLTGRVIDQTGAVVPKATVTAASGSTTRTAQTNAEGAYTFASLTPGAWQVRASAPQLTLPEPAAITLNPGVNRLDLELRVAVTAQQVDVGETGAPAVSTDPSSNAGAVVLQGDDLDALADDPEDLAADLQALAGPAAGPSGGAIFVDGFSGGQLPPKQSIREIRVNSNPFTPEYDKLGYGRVEIFTKPGADKFHGSIGYNLGTDWWNSRNPYAAVKAPFLLQETENSISGPLNKRSSFTLDFERQNVDNGSVSNGVILNSANQPEAFSSVLKTPQRHWLVGPHADYQLSANNTLSLRYLFTRAAITDAGIGSFDLTSRGYHQLINFDTAQAIENFVHGNIVNELRFQFFHERLGTDANTIAPVIQVSGSFTGGGATSPRNTDTQNNFELQNYTSVLHGKHFFRFGIRLRESSDGNYATNNFSGTYTFSGATGPQLDAANRIVTDATGAPVLINISSIEQYRRTLIFGANARMYGGGPSQFTLTAGNPAVTVRQFDAGPFFGDDWRLRPNITLSLGIRYEAQTNIADHRDFAPRVAIAWAPGSTAKKAGKTVLRLGTGAFYDRFPLSSTLTATRYNGLNQQQYVIPNPDFFPTIPSPALLASGLKSQTIQEVDSHLHSTYTISTIATVERQLIPGTTFTLSYLNAHGVHLLRSENINSPLPGTFNPSIKGSGVYPFPSNGPILLMTSSGIYNQNLIVPSVNSKLGSAFSVLAYYQWSRARSNTDGLNTYRANPWSDAGEYGPSNTDIRHRALVAGTLNLRGNIRLNPNIELRSGQPFNITAGQDIYGTTIFNARPGITTDPKRPGVVATSYGLLDPNPIPGETILPRNYGRSPAQILLNLRIGKTWGFGPEKGSGGSGVASRDNKASGATAISPPSNANNIFARGSTARRYNVSLQMSVRNLLNHNNPGPIIGSITSPLFGQANQIAGTANGEGFLETASNRRLEMQIRFTY